MQTSVRASVLGLFHSVLLSRSLYPPIPPAVPHAGTGYTWHLARPAPASRFPRDGVVVGSGICSILEHGEVTQHWPHDFAIDVDVAIAVDVDVDETRPPGPGFRPGLQRAPAPGRLFTPTLDCPNPMWCMVRATWPLSIIASH